jgi:hypothetical protein
MKITKKQLVGLINEELQLMKEERLLNEQYDVVLERINTMSYEELHEAVLGRLAQKLGGAAAGAVKAGAQKLGGAVKTGAEKVAGAVGQKVQAAKTAATSTLQNAKASMEKTKEQVLAMYDEAQKEEVKAIMDAARQKAAQQTAQTLADFVTLAKKKNIPNPEAIALGILTSIYNGFQEQMGRNPNTGMGKIGQPGVTVGGAAASGIAEE